MSSEYYSDRSSSKLAFALAREVQQYVQVYADEFDSDTWDSIQYWRSGILSQGAVTEENLAELMSYIGAEKLQELIVAASQH